MADPQHTDTELEVVLLFCNKVLEEDNIGLSLTNSSTEAAAPPFRIMSVLPRQQQSFIFTHPVLNIPSLVKDWTPTLRFTALRWFSFVDEKSMRPVYLLMIIFS